MDKKIRYRALFILAVILACVIGIVGLPRNYQQLKENIAQHIKLGLDLKGGTHLILQVHVDDAVKVVRDQAQERLKDEAEVEVQLVPLRCPGPERARLANCNRSRIFLPSWNADTSIPASVAARCKLGHEKGFDPKLGSVQLSSIISMPKASVNFPSRNSLRASRPQTAQVIVFATIGYSESLAR